MNQYGFGASTPNHLRIDDDVATRPSAEVPFQGAPQVEFPARRVARDSDARLVILRGPGAGTAVALTAPLTTIGRHQHCDIVVDDHTVSRRHAELYRDGERFTVVDVGSLNGTYLNRRPVEHAELTDYDEIWIGKARFIFRTDGS